MGRRTGLTQPLSCPNCSSQFAAVERFCPACKLPLVKATDPGRPAGVSERHRRARKIKPQLAEGQLIQAAWARNQAEAELIQGLLLEEGVPSLVRRSAGFDVPDFLAAGPRDILVPMAGAATAREVLLEAEVIRPSEPTASVQPARLLVGLLAALALGAFAVWVASVLVH